MDESEESDDSQGCAPLVSFKKKAGFFQEENEVG